MAENILQWLEQAGGIYDTEAIGIKDYSDVGMGWGAVALKDLEASLDPLFSAPLTSRLITLHAEHSTGRYRSLYDPRQYPSFRLQFWRPQSCCGRRLGRPGRERWMGQSDALDDVGGSPGRG